MDVRAVNPYGTALLYHGSQDGFTDHDRVFAAHSTATALQAVVLAGAVDGRGTLRYFRVYGDL